MTMGITSTKETFFSKWPLQKCLKKCSLVTTCIVLYVFNDIIVCYLSRKVEYCFSILKYLIQKGKSMWYCAYCMVMLRRLTVASNILLTDWSYGLSSEVWLEYNYDILAMDGSNGVNSMYGVCKYLEAIGQTDKLKTKVGENM